MKTTQWAPIRHVKRAPHASNWLNTKEAVCLCYQCMAQEAPHAPAWRPTTSLDGASRGLLTGFRGPTGAATLLNLPRGAAVWRPSRSPASPDCCCRDGEWRHPPGEGALLAAERENCQGGSPVPGGTEGQHLEAITGMARILHHALLPIALAKAFVCALGSCRAEKLVSQWCSPGMPLPHE